VKTERRALELYREVALARDIPDEGLRKGDVAVLVDRVSGDRGAQGCVLEVFNALGETLKVVTVPESAVEPITAGEILSVRAYRQTA
jgi:hypothetical protein